MRGTLAGLALVVTLLAGCVAGELSSSGDDVPKAQKQGTGRFVASVKGTALQQLVLARAAGIAPQNRPYVFNGVQDCYGFVRQVWNAILHDGAPHQEDYHPNPYNRSRWLSVAGGLPVDDAVSSKWVHFSDPAVLLPGDVLATHQGHAWGNTWHGGIYAGTSGATHHQWDNTNDAVGSGAFKRTLYSGFRYYYKPTHDLLAQASGAPAATGSGVGAEVACPSSSCSALASGSHDILSCQDGKTLVRCQSGKPRCFTCKTGTSCFFNNGGDGSDDFCSGSSGGSGGSTSCTACSAAASATGSIWACEESASRLVRCNEGCMETKKCAEGCTYNNGGTGHDDVCGKATSSAGGIPGGCATLTIAQVEYLLRWAKFPEWAIPEMVRIACCESGFYTCAISKASWNPGKDWGLFQIAADYWLFQGETGYSLHDPWTNVSRAKHVFDQQGLGAWSCHYMTVPGCW